MVVYYKLLMEDGSALLQEDGSFILLDGYWYSDSTFTNSGIVEVTGYKFAGNDGIIKVLNNDLEFTEDASVAERKTSFIINDGLVKISYIKDFSEDGIIKVLNSDKTFLNSGIIEVTGYKFLGQDGIVKVLNNDKNFSQNGIVMAIVEKMFSNDAIVKIINTKTFTEDGIVKVILDKQFTENGIVKVLNNDYSFTNNGNVVGTFYLYLGNDGIIKIRDEVKDFSNDASVKVYNEETIFSNDGIVAIIKRFTNDGVVAVVSPIIAGPMFSMFNMKCNVKRRASTPTKDILNAPSYGTVDTWDNVYVNIPCRLEIIKSPIQFKPTGERVLPVNILYVDCSTPLKIQDRIILDNKYTGLRYSQEFIVQGAQPALDMLRRPQHHLEYRLTLS